MPAEILTLVDRFETHRESYQSAAYNETQLRREFIDPFFKALGWDVDNTQGYAEAYKDVIHEDQIRIGSATKAPDYCFRVGGARKFFVEAKKPHVNVKDDISPAYQLRRYAWSAKLPLSILTDFEELAVYDCRIRPGIADKASTARVLFMQYTEYDDRWDELAAIFSRQAILKGSFDKYAESKTKKRGTAEVDAEFLADIEGWRKVLANNLAVRNDELSQREVNFAVQRTIDRIVFLRICEDRGIETYGRLQGLTNGSNIYRRLCQFFEEADDRYNSGLFHFHSEKGRAEAPDELTLTLDIDDKTLREIIRNLYYPDSPYEFSVLGADILGQVYEQFLGKVIRLTKGHHAVVEDKPDVKKAGGVFYTPTYIVDYIVEQTVGKLLEGTTPIEVGGLTQKWQPAKNKQPLSVLDPACGSGSFLIGAYQKLLDWHRDWYVANNPAEHSQRIFQAASGEWRLTTAERKRILLSHIYGVDIDPQAVEVTKLSLLLKVLEGANQELLQRQLRMFKERALPDLGNNIKCGNSLIGPDIFNGVHMALLDEEELLRLNVFDWKREFFGIMRRDGFDTIIGNPPYVRMEMFKSIKDYLRKKYAAHAERTDLYVYFIEREHALLKEDGRLGMIVSNKFVRAQYGQSLRKYLQSSALVERIVDLAGLPVFRGATVRTIVLVTRKRSSSDKTPVRYSPPPAKEDLVFVAAGTRTLAEIADPLVYEVPAKNLSAAEWRLIRPEFASLMDRLKEGAVTLNEFVGRKICMGIKSGLTDAFVLTPAQRKATLAKNSDAKRIIRPFAQGREIHRYEIDPVSEYLIYTPHGIDMKPYPAVLEHLRPFRKQLENRATEQEWYELQQPQFAYERFLREPKIVFPDIATGCRFALDTKGRFGANTVYFIPTADLALLGLLNSTLALFFFQQTCAALEGPGEAYLRFFGQYLEPFPVRLPPAGSRAANELIDLVARIMQQKESRTKLKTAHEKTALQRQIDALDRQIDQLVYALYGLTEDEIAIVEEATRGATR